MNEHTTEFNMANEQANRVAYCWSKGVSIITGTDHSKAWGIQYNTAIKGEPMNSLYPEECWAVTNRFDPDVARGE